MPPAILLIQGIGLVGEGWRPQVDGLSGAFDPIVFDNRGIGRNA
jgi:pimeloyl-ACP methyl ester carboxylesterase